MLVASSIGAWLALGAPAHAAGTIPGSKRVCVYSQNETELVPTFAALVGRNTVDCGMVYVGGSTWSSWDSPWFVHYVDPNYNWATWVKNSPANDPRQLIVNTTLIPSGVASDPNWRAEGASGAFESYDQTFAQTLVSNGLSNAIIVLGAEANGNWEYDNIGSTSAQVAQWVQTWRNTVISMRAVPGANFQFVWAVNNRVPATPFASYYPGDDVVDIIGDDAYDMGVTDDANDWNEVANSTDGVNALVAFAQAHGKPIAFPEWGVGVRNSSNLAGNDDPAYVNGLAGVVAGSDTAFQCYFFNDEWETELQQGPFSLAAYQQAFGDGGWAVGADDGEAVTPTPAYPQQTASGSGNATATTTPTTATTTTATTATATTATATTATASSSPVTSPTVPAAAATPAPTATTASATTTVSTASAPAKSTTKATSTKRRPARRRTRSRVRPGRPGHPAQPPRRRRR